MKNNRQGVFSSSILEKDTDFRSFYISFPNIFSINSDNSTSNSNFAVKKREMISQNPVIFFTKMGNELMIFGYGFEFCGIE